MSTNNPNCTHWHPETLAVRFGQQRSELGEHSEPIHLTSSFVFDNAAQAAARFAEQESGYMYSRHTNPTVDALQRRLAVLEGGDACIATASGMSAILSLCLTVLEQGDRILSSASLFGSTVGLFRHVLGKFGVTTDFVPLTDLEAWQKAIHPTTRLLFIETPSNPLMEVADLQSLANLAHENNCLLVVDNCFCSPFLQQPLRWGADVVIHSTTKYIDGQGRCLGGAIIGNHDLVGQKVFSFLRTAGPTMSPFNAWLFNRGLETLPVRMARHCENAHKLAHWLQDHPSVEQVFYPGLPHHPGHALAKKQQRQFGGMVSFRVRGGQVQAWQVIDRTQLISITANLGDTRTTLTHPATTTHGRLCPEERQQAGISDNLLRLSVGLEHSNDLQQDLAHGLDSLPR